MANNCHRRPIDCHRLTLNVLRCLAEPGSDFPFFYVMGLVKVSTPILLLLSLLALRCMLRCVWHLKRTRCGERPGRELRSKREWLLDKLEVLETVIFQIQLTSSWRVAYELARAMNAGGSMEPAASLSYAGGVLAYTLFALEGLYLTKYAYMTWRIIQAGVADERVAKRLGVRHDAVAGGEGGNAHYLKRLELRTSYMTKRFRKGAHGWQVPSYSS